MAIRLVVSEETQLGDGGAVQVERVPARLDDAAYDRWLRTADVILLPYATDRYRHSTSGIFAETVVSGGIPLVSPGTWMASQLEKYGLKHLAIDWGDSRATLRRIAELAVDPAVRAGLDRMRGEFAAYHSEPSYARAMQALAGGHT
jgi:hypothetical protein